MEDKEERIWIGTSCSDRAAHLVNGMLFPNGGEDGTNLVKVRTFTAKPEHY